MKVRLHKGKEPGPDLEGYYYRYMLDAAFLVSEPGAAATERLPFAVMHMPKPLQQIRVLAREPATAEDGPADTPADAPSAGHLAAASETTPERPESPEEVTGLIESLSLAGPASSSGGGGGAGDGGEGATACTQCGIRSAELKRCLRCLQVAYCSKE